MNDMIIQLLSRGTSMDKLALMFMKRAEGDLKSAEVLFDAERYADFHCLRHTTGSLLAASGVHPKVA